MKLFDKLKDILFDEDEEEVETQVTPQKVVTNIKEEIKPVVKEEVELPKSIPAPEVNDTLDNTFKFPLFDEKEFENTRPSRVDLYDKKERKENSLNNVIPADKEVPRNNIKYSTRDYEKFLNEPKEEKKAKFKPSPNISPVYGILDKNYKIEDYQPIVKEKKSEENKPISVEDVRKKAFGTLNNDLEATLNKSLQDFYEETKVVEETISFDEPKEDTFKTTDLKETLNDIKDNLSDLTNAMNNLGDKVDNKSKDIDEELDKPRSAMELLNEIESELDEITKNKENEANNIEVELDIPNVEEEPELEESAMPEDFKEEIVEDNSLNSDEVEIDLSSYNEDEEVSSSDNDELFNLIDAMYDVENTDKDSE